MRHTPTVCDQSMDGAVVAESALDVLSRAASLVTNEVTTPAGRWREQLEEMQSKLKHEETKVASLRDFRLKTLKQRRKKQRNHDYITAKLKARRTTSTQSTQTSMTLMKESSPDSELGNAVNYDDDDEDDDEDMSDREDVDMPLDMTTTKRNTSTRKENRLPDSSTMLRKCLLTSNPTPLLRPGLQSQHRPSVITRTSLASPKGGDKKASSGAGQSRSGHERRHGHRREILSGMCDPVIDEHFRRSLGKDYSEVFSSSPVSGSSSSSSSTVSVCGLSVDDHFSKALGDIWLQLQKKTHPSNRSSPSPSLSPELAPPVSPLIQQC